MSEKRTLQNGVFRELLLFFFILQFSRNSFFFLFFFKQSVLNKVNMYRDGKCRERPLDPELLGETGGEAGQLVKL